MLGDAAAWPWDLAQCRFPVATSVVGPITPERPELSTYEPVGRLRSCPWPPGRCLVVGEDRLTHYGLKLYV